MTGTSHVAAVVAAAGQSTRMGTPKQLLPWRDSTVIASVAKNLELAGAEPVVVVVGHEADLVAAALAKTRAVIVRNAAYGSAEMLRSYQAALRTLSAERYAGALLALGDQPHVPVDVLRAVVDAANEDPDKIVIPSHSMRRGHPIYLPARLWRDVLDLDVNDTLRTLLDRHADRIRYELVDTPAILRDLDTPADYEALRPD